ncbi:12419_t:CDS:2 [Acaulospora colombiana]|uniref:12419_t:CDS:1 n=1 Tax=Acaulospora colombiana TaxID=27376 RepID=A0ACA9LC97_9GLOM|nr:12419_t:CDS:2 [Acaulospora colombiana]
MENSATSSFNPSHSGRVQKEWFENAIESGKIVKFDYKIFDNFQNIRRGAFSNVDSATLKAENKTVALKTITLNSTFTLELFVNERPPIDKVVYDISKIELPRKYLSSSTNSNEQNDYPADEISSFGTCELVDDYAEELDIEKKMKNSGNTKVLVVFSPLDD